MVALSTAARVLFFYFFDWSAQWLQLGLQEYRHRRSWMMRKGFGSRRHDTLDRKCRRNLAGGFS
jgi:hypothetical protein